jgi:hypothetical protein
MQIRNRVRKLRMVRGRVSSAYVAVGPERLPSMELKHELVKWS